MKCFACYNPPLGLFVEPSFLRIHKLIVTGNTLRHARDVRLAELWRHRQSLDEREWEELYRIVVEVLRQVRFKELKSLADEIEDLIQSFFVQAVMQRGLNGSTAACDHAGALCIYFRNYVIDELRARAAQSRPVLAGDMLCEEQSVDEEDFFDRCALVQGSADPVAAQPEVSLGEIGIRPESVLVSATDFLKQQDQWVGLYLGLHFCADDENSLPLYEVAKRHQIPSYHARAARLGITRKKTDRPADYAKTILGQWLAGLTGGAFDQSLQAAYTAALKILCLAVASSEEMPS